MKKIERMKQGPAENMTIAILNNSRKIKELRLQIFNTQAGYVTAYDGCFFNKPKQFYFAHKEGR